jgi:MFS family permease
MAGSLGTAYFILCVSGAPRVKFLTELGASAIHFGLIDGLASLTIVFQILGGILANLLPRRKPAWIALTIVHRLVFVGVLASPWLFAGERIRLGWIIAVLCVHDVLANLGTPMWFSWMADLVPRDAMNRHWASRQRTTTAVNVAVSIFVAFFFNHFEESGQAILGFLLLASVGVVAGVTDILLFLAVPEPEYDRPAKSAIWETITQPLRDKDFRPFLAFRAYWAFAAGIAWPFFTLYAIEFLRISVRDTQLMMMAGPLGVLVSARFWGLMCDTYGQRPMLQMAMTGKAIVPLAFMAALPGRALCVPFLAVILFFDGMLNSGFFLSTQGIMLKYTPRQNRSMYVGAANFLSVGIAAAIGPFFGGALIDAVGEPRWSVGVYAISGFHLVFGASVVLRFLANPLVSRLHEPESLPLGAILRHICDTHPLRATRAVYQLHEARNDEQRVRAARRLGELGSPLAIRELIPSLQDASRPVRRAAAEALGRIGAAEATQALIQALFDPESGIQSPAARALGHIGGRHSLQALLASLRRLDSEALIETIDSLVRIGDSAAILPLICLCDEIEDRALRRHIAVALARLSETDSAEEIAAILSPSRPNSTALRP